MIGEIQEHHMNPAVYEESESKDRVCLSISIRDSSLVVIIPSASNVIPKYLDKYPTRIC